MDALKKQLGELLTAINFEGDKEEYVDSFLKLCQEEAFLQTLRSFPQEETKNLKPEELQNHEVFKQKYQELLPKVIDTNLTQYFEKISPYLTEAHLNKLRMVINSLSV